MATPRVTALNNCPAQIESSSQIPVQTTQAASGTAVVTTTFVSVPLRLSITPQITDVGTVVLRVTIENNTLNGGIAVGGVPGIDTQRMQSEVLVPDGGTTVMGGVLADTEGETQQRTPVLLPFQLWATCSSASSRLVKAARFSSIRRISIVQTIRDGQRQAQSAPVNEQSRFLSRCHLVTRRPTRRLLHSCSSSQLARSRRREHLNLCPPTPTAPTGSTTASPVHLVVSARKGGNGCLKIARE